MKQVLSVLAIVLILVAMLAAPASALKNPFDYRNPGGGDDQPWGGEQHNDDWGPGDNPTSSFEMKRSGVWVLDVIISGVIKTWQGQDWLTSPDVKDEPILEQQSPTNDRTTVKGN
jgi:hypothetical protein